MSRSERIIVWTGRFSDEQVSIAILAGYLGAWIVFAAGFWWVLS